MSIGIKVFYTKLQFNYWTGSNIFKFKFHINSVVIPKHNDLDITCGPKLSVGIQCVYITFCRGAPIEHLQVQLGEALCDTLHLRGCASLSPHAYCVRCTLVWLTIEMCLCSHSVVDHDVVIVFFVGLPCPRLPIHISLVLCSDGFHWSSCHFRPIPQHYHLGSWCCGAF